MALDTFRRRIARWIAPQPRVSGKRLYNAAQPSRLTFGFGSGTTSGDGELSSSLTTLRNRSRQLMRDNAYAKRARSIITNNVVGSGIGIQGQVMTTRGELAGAVNDAIEMAWDDWARAGNCHTGGTLHFHDLERMACDQVVEAGEVLIRKHYRTFGESRIPIALEMVEAERLVENQSTPFLGQVGQVRMGVETDEFFRPVAYYLRRKHPGDMRWSTLTPDEVIRVPAAEIIHLRLVDRFPMTRGVPWLHTVIRALNDLGATTEAEITAARAAACYMGFIETAETPDAPGVGDTASNGQATIGMEPGLIERLAYGEKMNFVASNRPNNALPDFLRYMLREMAAGIGVSYESLSRDYSQSNYSSSRLALLDDRDLWRVLQQWWVRSFREPLHREWLQAGVLSRAITSIPVEAYAADRARYEAVKWKLRGWSWVDPTKEVSAYVMAVRAGFTTVTDVIAQTAGGSDIEDVINTRKRELAMFDDAGIDVDSNPGEFDAAGKAIVEPTEPAPQPAAAPPRDTGDEETDSVDQTARLARVVSLGR